MRLTNDDFWKSESGLFFAGGLERPNQLERASEKARLTQARFSPRVPLP
jgi:hypothetical protein